MNADNLELRASYPESQLCHLHGDFFTLKCTSFDCSYRESKNYSICLTPALAPDPVYNAENAESEPEPLGTRAISISELPTCPSCRTGLLRPGVVWYGEPLPLQAVTTADDFISSPPIVDLILVIGTSGNLWPAAGYAEQVKMRGGKVAVFNKQPTMADIADWMILGDAAITLPQALEPIVGSYFRPKRKY